MFSKTFAAVLKQQRQQQTLTRTAVVVVVVVWGQLVMFFVNTTDRLQYATKTEAKSMPLCVCAPNDVQ